MAERIASNGPVDVLLTHACPIGLVDASGPVARLERFERRGTS